MSRAGELDEAGGGEVRRLVVSAVVRRSESAVSLRLCVLLSAGVVLVNGPPKRYELMDCCCWCEKRCEEAADDEEASDEGERGTGDCVGGGLEQPHVLQMAMCEACLLRHVRHVHLGAVATVLVAFDV